MRAQRGFSLLETCVALAIASMLLVAGGVWLLGTRPGSLARTASDFDAALAAARAIAAASGAGATLVFAPRHPQGFTLRVYRGRPMPNAIVEPSAAMPSISDASVIARRLREPPFSVFIGASGHVSAIASYPRFDARGNPIFASIPTEPPCPKGGIELHFSSPNATVTRTIPCAASPAPGPQAPNPSPTPNAPLLTPPGLVYHWPADATQTLTATEWGYTHWFAAVGGFACGDAIAMYPDILPSPFAPPYDPAEGTASPSPPPGTPFSYPNSHGASMNDAPAPFPLAPNGEGLCVASVADDFGQAARAGVQVMGWLTATYRGRRYAHNTTPALHLPSSAFAQRGATAVLAMSKTYDAQPLQPAVVFDRACAPYVTFSVAPGTTPRSPSHDPATARVSLTLVTMPSSRTDCGGVVYDQYPGSMHGEGVPFNAEIGESPCPNAGNAWQGPHDRVCYDLYSAATGTTETGGWIAESEVGLYVAHGTPGTAIYQWTVDDGACSLHLVAGTDFADWSILLGNGDVSPPPIATPAPLPNPAGFDLTYVTDTVIVTRAPDPKPTQPSPLLCKPLPTPSPQP